MSDVPICPPPLVSPFIELLVCDMPQQKPQSSDVDVGIKIGDSETSIEFPAERMTVSCPVTKIGDRLYRVEGVAMSEAAGFRDVIEAEDLGCGKLRFLRVAQPSGWKTFDCLVPRGWLDAERGVAFLGELDKRGLHWERIVGGMLFICVPPGTDLDPTALVQAAVRSATEPRP